VPILRIVHTGAYLEASLEGDGARQSVKRPFAFTLTPQEAEDIRWYLEEYPIYPVDPSPKIAKRIEKRMGEVGRELFRLVLGGSDVWESVRWNLGDTRIEVETELGDALVPWELMRDPVSDLPLALSVPSFVRCHSRPALRPDPPGQTAGKIRILLVIWVLRPPTFLSNSRSDCALRRRMGSPAREWAQSALRDFQACENADQEVVNTLKLLEQIESGLQATPPPA